MNKRGHVLNAVSLAIAVGIVLEPAGSVDTLRRITVVFVPLVLGALLPDVDTHFGEHRKTLHNLPVLALVVVYPVIFDNLHWVWLGVVSHYVLDMLGTTRGVALLYPFLDAEFDAPVGVPVDSHYADVMTLAVTAFEIVVVIAIVHVVPGALPGAFPVDIGL
jgi:membrane-bound metal-dependent hydrolase YbcI (DUF457 family)